MTNAEQRYDRQLRLAEVGRSGQARLASARVNVAEAGDQGVEVEVEYLQRAGVSVERSNRTPTPEFTHAQLFENSESREVAAGAWRALSQIRRALGVETSG